MTTEYVREHYGLDIKIGQRVELHRSKDHRIGTIVGADHHVLIRWDGLMVPLRYHPLDPALKWLAEQEASDGA